MTHPPCTRETRGPQRAQSRSRRRGAGRLRRAAHAVGAAGGGKLGVDAGLRLGNFTLIQ